MNILAIETSSYCGSIAVIKDNTVLGEVFFNIGPKNSEKIVSSIEWLLNNLNLAKKDLEAVAVSKGPGSFTSLRIGISVAKGIAFALNIKLLGVSSSKIVASNYNSFDKRICTLIDAKRGEVYASTFSYKNNILQTDFLDKMIKVEELASFVDKSMVFLGEGALVYRDLIFNSLGKEVSFVPEYFNYPKASLCGLIAHSDLDAGNFDDVYTFSPNYIRKPDVEVDK